MDMISIHVPKTAGRSFFSALKTIYGQDILEDYIGQSHPVSQNHHNVLKEQVNLIPDNIRVIHGHFNSIKYKDYYPEAKRIVWLRNPVNRLISHYFYLKNNLIPGDSFHKRMLDKNMSLLEFIEAPIMINQIRAAYLPAEMDNSIFFAGIVERFEEDFKKLKNQMNWPDIILPKENETISEEYKNFKLDKLTKKRIEELNDLDMELYFKFLN